jgi:hypothetical protein
MNSVTQSRRIHNRTPTKVPDRTVEFNADSQPEHRTLNFADTHLVVAVDRNIQNYRLSMTGSTQDIILSCQIDGKYWLYIDGNDNWLLIPKHQITITEDELPQFESFFDCQNYRGENYNNFTIVKPASVTVIDIIPDRHWRLIEKGILQFG